VCRRQDCLSFAPRSYSKGLSLEHWILCKRKGSIAPSKKENLVTVVAASDIVTDIGCCEKKLGGQSIL
jgi:hypothetical protein